MKRSQAVQYATIALFLATLSFVEAWVAMAQALNGGWELSHANRLCLTTPAFIIFILSSAAFGLGNRKGVGRGQLWAIPVSLMAAFCFHVYVSLQLAVS